MTEMASLAPPDKLRYVWTRMALLGASDSDLQQLVTIAQDMELMSVCEVFRSVIEMGRTRLPPQVLDVLRLVMEELVASSVHRRVSP